jgi:hypothetical protein
MIYKFLIFVIKNVREVDEGTRNYGENNVYQNEVTVLHEPPSAHICFPEPNMSTAHTFVIAAYSSSG